MPPKTKPRNKWNDVQTAIAAVTVVTTLGLWNLFAQPAKKVSNQAQVPTDMPPTEPPVEADPTAIPQVKIMFTQTAPQQTFTNVQPQNKNKKKRNNNNGGGGKTVTQTKTS